MHVLSPKFTPFSCAALFVFAMSVPASAATRSADTTPRPLPTAETAVTFPLVSIEASPAEIFSVSTEDGAKASAVARKPPGKGPFPAIIFLHGGLNQRNIDHVKRTVATQVTNSRFVAAGYVTVESVFRSRSDDPQSKEAFLDCRAIIERVKKMPEVDPRSIVLLGHSGGGSLALELAGEMELAAIVAGEPASIIFTGMFNEQTRSRADRDRLMEEPKRYYTPALQTFTRQKIERIACPVLIVQGDQHPINKINDEIVVPELKAAGKDFRVIVYPGQPHNFVFGQQGTQAATSKCFQDSETFVRKYLPTKPVALEGSLVTPTVVEDRAKRERPGGGKDRSGDEPAAQPGRADSRKRR